VIDEDRYIKILAFEELGEDLVTLSFSEEQEEFAHKEEFNMSPYKFTCIHQED